MGKFVVLKLKKGEEIQEIILKTDNLHDMAKKSVKLAKLNKAGWSVLDVSGNDPEKVAFMGSIAAGAKPGAKDMLKAAGLKDMPKQVKKFFKK